MNKIKKYQIPSSPLYLNNPASEWASKWKERLLPSGGSKVLQQWNASGKKPKPETSTEYALRQFRNSQKRTWRSDAADVAAEIKEGVLALHPYTAIPYFGAKVGLDFLNGTYGLHTVLNALVPLFHLAPKPGINTVINSVKDDTNPIIKNILHPGTFVFDHLPYKTIYDIKSRLRDIKTFLNTPVTENPFKAIKNSKLKPIKFEEEIVLPEEINPNSLENPVELLKSRYKYAYENNPLLYDDFDPLNGGILLEENPVYVSNVENVPVKTHISIKDAYGLSNKNILKTINTYIEGNTNPGFYYREPGKSFIKLNEKALKDFGFKLEDTKAHELVHALDLYPNRSLGVDKFMNLDLLSNSTKKYFTEHGNTELVARGSLLKNYFGLKGGERITPEMLKYAAKNYIKDTKMNNNMNELFNSIKDWNIAADWFSKFSLKQGGKMNIIDFLKNGSGIYIKESLKGSFTKYCNGKVTEECIRRGKNSPNPKIRKKATFAANARKWKHLLGGQLIKAQEGLKLNFGLKIGNFLNSDLGKSALSFISNGVNAISNQSKITNFSNEFDKATEAGKKSLLIQNWNKKYKEGLTMGLQYFQMLQLYNPGINFGTIDIQNFAKNYADSAGNSEEINEYENNRLAMKKDYIQSMLQSDSSSGGFDIAGLLGTAGQFLSLKSKTPSDSTVPVTDNYDYINWTNNYYA